MADKLRLRQEALTWRVVEDEVVALDLHDSVYLAANRTGARLWALLAKGTTREALITSLVEGFGVTTEAAVADVDRFLSQLSQRRLLEG